MPFRLTATSALFFIGAIFFLFEAALHALGLPILEHDKIFLFTHDRYIALYALTMAAMMAITASDLQRYRMIFFIVMGSIFLGIANAMPISHLGGYEVLFPPAKEVDGELSGLGIGMAIWYAGTWLSFLFSKQS